MKKKFGTGILVFVLCFGYLFLQNKIPDEVSVRPGIFFRKLCRIWKYRVTRLIVRFIP